MTIVETALGTRGRLLRLYFYAYILFIFVNDFPTLVLYLFHIQEL